MRWLIWLVISVSICAHELPLSKNSLLFEFTPEIQREEVDFPASLELFYNFNFFYFRVKSCISSIPAGSLQNEIDAGLYINSLWFIGAGVELVSEKSENSALTQVTPAIEILYAGDVIKTSFQYYLNGHFSWGAVLSPHNPENLIPFEITAQYEYNRNSDLKLHIALLPLNGFKFGLFYRFFQDMPGIDFSARIFDQFEAGAFVAHNFLNPGRLDFGVSFVLYFREHEHRSADEITK